ncbi:hypothetical protein AB0F17_58670 [Nonomuraea sp. NPDC026600]|uniref:hypothetical protein n=1 Tax=Nonomuraea sp. NPDC026600 TaxID=3155363 RepID=UPI0033C49BC6
MSLRTELLYFIACDTPGCSNVHHVPTDDSALGARISAGMDGWRHIAARPGGRNGKGKRLGADHCPDCVAAKESR